MAREVPRDRPLTDEDRAYLESRNHNDVIALIDQNHGREGDAAAGQDLSVFGGEEKPYEEMTKAELDAEIDVRNGDAERPDDKKLSKSGTNADKVARLRADDDWLDSLDG